MAEIKLQNINKAFGSNEVLKDLNLEFSGSGITAILGPNGSGKTTLIKSILGMVIIDSGEIDFNGIDIQRQHAYRNSIDYLPQIARFPENLKVSELFDLIQDIRSKPSRSKELIDLFEIGNTLNQKLKTLSGGTRQKVNIIQSMMFDSPVLILDEPTSGLDPLSLIRLKELIFEEKQKGKTILFTTHIMNLVDEIADRVVYLLDGNIYFDGTPTQLIEKYKTQNIEHAIAEILRVNTTPFSANGKEKQSVEMQTNHP